MIEIIEACEAIPYRHQRRLKNELVPAGAILEWATEEEVATHIPKKYVNPSRGHVHPYVWLHVEPGCTDIFYGVARLNSGNIGVIRGRVKFEAVMEESIRWPEWNPEWWKAGEGDD